MLVGAAVLPTAPLLVPGVAATLPRGVSAVCDAIDVAVESLPPHEAVILVAAGEQGALYAAGDAGLASIGRPDITLSTRVHVGLAQRLSGIVQYALSRGDALPLPLSVLALLLGDGNGIVPLTVPSTASFDALVAVGVGIGKAVTDEEVRAAVVVAGDLSAGLEARSPLSAVEGAAEFDARIVEAADGGRLEILSRLGPQEAARVGAVGWPAMAVLHGVLETAKLGLVRRHYSAPRGVGYLVAHGA